MDTAEQVIDDVLAVMGGGKVTGFSEAVDYLTYCNYRANRGYGVSAADLAKLWPQTGAAMERRYEAEINAYAERKIRGDQAARHTGTPAGDLDIFGRKLEFGS